MAYGWTVTETDDRLVTLMEEAFALSARISKLGQWLNIFPASERKPPLYHILRSELFIVSTLYSVLVSRRLFQK